MCVKMLKTTHNQKQAFVKSICYMHYKIKIPGNRRYGDFKFKIGIS